MLTIQYIKEQKENVLEGLNKRNFKSLELIDLAIEIDDKRKSIQYEMDNLLAESNQLAKQIGQLYAQGKQQEANEFKEKTSEIKIKTKTLEENLKTIENQLKDVLYQIPNIPHSSVKQGVGAEDNEVVYENDKKAELPTQAKPHWEIVEKYNLINFELGVKITGSGFPVYIGKGAKLQRSLIQYFLDKNTQAGYTEINPPFVVNEASGYGTGQLPDKEGQMYFINEDNLYLIPTSEVPLTNMYRDVLLQPQQLPIKLTAYSPCFRREAGSYGKDVRGLNRLHQFEKVEIVRIEKPENSYQVLEEMVNHVKGLLEDLELPYRILRLCGGDMGFTAALTYDFEVWSAAQEKWLEVSSVSNFEAFQANRLKLRYRDESKNLLCHTLNGSSLALPRIMAAIIENHQTQDGIKIPKKIQPYTGFEFID